MFKVKRVKYPLICLLPEWPRLLTIRCKRKNIRISTGLYNRIAQGFPNTVSTCLHTSFRVFLFYTLYGITYRLPLQRSILGADCRRDWSYNTNTQQLSEDSCILWRTFEKEFKCSRTKSHAFAACPSQTGMHWAAVPLDDPNRERPLLQTYTWN